MFNLSFGELIIRIPVILLALTFHEFSHGFSAHLLGDSTAKSEGRLSLNPIRHLDPLGFICLLVFRFGWAKPVMINPYNLKNPKQDMAIISFAGPFSNLVLAFISMLIYYPAIYLLEVNGITQYVFMFLSELLYINLVLAIFNLIPVPPLDGSKLFAAVLPDRLYFDFLNLASKFGFIFLLILIWTGATSKIISPVINVLIRGMWFLMEKIYFFL